MTERVRLEAVITVPVVAFVDEDVYEKWLAGERAAGDVVANSLSEAGREAIDEHANPAGTVLQRAVLVEDDGYLGTDIAVLKKF